MLFHEAMCQNQQLMGGNQNSGVVTFLTRILHTHAYVVYYNCIEAQMTLSGILFTCNSIVIF